MRVAALYDIHGNLPALEAVLREIQQVGVEQIVVGGDLFPGPFPHEVLACLQGLEVPTQFILGNGDREVLARLRGMETDWYRTAPEAWRLPVDWTACQLCEEDGHIVAQWPATCRMDIPGLGTVLFCHATPRSDTETVTRLTPDDRLVSILGHEEAAMVVCGHTHMQFDRMVGGCRVVNAGSVGMPFGPPGAYWLLLEPEVALQHCLYDLAGAAERIRQTDYPQAHVFAVHSVVSPPDEDAMLAVFARAEQTA